MDKSYREREDKKRITEHLRRINCFYFLIITLKTNLGKIIRKRRPVLKKDYENMSDDGHLVVDDYYAEIRDTENTDMQNVEILSVQIVRNIQGDLFTLCHQETFP